MDIKTTLMPGTQTAQELAQAGNLPENAKPEKKAEEAALFEGALAVAQQVQQNQRLAQQQSAKQEKPGTQEEGSPKQAVVSQVATSDPQLQEGLMRAMLPPEQSRSLSALAEQPQAAQARLPKAALSQKLTQSQERAASMNAAAAIAGPNQPWSKDWVFDRNMQGGESGNPELRGLFEKAQPEKAELPKGSDVTQAVKPGNQPAPAAAALDPKHPQPNQAHLAQPTSGSHDAALEASLAALGAEILGVRSDGSGNGDAPAGKDARASRPALAPATAGAAGALSGSDFLAMRQPQQQSGFGFGQQRQQPRHEELTAVASKTRNPAGLQVIEGGLASRVGHGRQAERERGGDESDALFGAALGAAGQGQGHGTAVKVEVAAPVTQGAGAQERLTSEALQGIGTELRNFGKNGTGGEIRVRLKPENLGELHLKVVTSGNQVGLQIQASDERAKRILEESMSHLKESLASQNLSLGRVDVSVASATGSAFGAGLAQGDQQQASQQFQQQPQQHSLLQGGHHHQQQQSQQGGGRWNDGGDDLGRVSASSAGPRVAPAAMARRSAAPAGRLNVMA